MSSEIDPPWSLTERLRRATIAAKGGAMIEEIQSMAGVTRETAVLKWMEAKTPNGAAGLKKSVREIEPWERDVRRALAIQEDSDGE